MDLCYTIFWLWDTDFDFSRYCGCVLNFFLFRKRKIHLQKIVLLKMCYRFEKHEYNRGLLSNVDATYIIHLENNGRLENILNQLEKYQPTKTVYIVFNKGFKNCPKALVKQLPAVDLVDAFWECFKHAQTQAYGNILILEDDFMFNDKIKHANEEIDQFLDENKGKYIYMLGCIPYLSSPASKSFNHYNIYASTATHSVIYTRPLREQILQTTKDDILDWDVHINSICKKYGYHEPLCYQLFPDTENSTAWKSNIGGSTIRGLLKMAGLDKQAEPGFSIFYFLSKALFWIFIGAFVLLLWFHGFHSIFDYILIFIFSLFFQQFFIT